MAALLGFPGRVVYVIKAPLEPVKLIEGIGKGSSDFDNRFANQSAKGAFKVPSGLGLVRVGAVNCPTKSRLMITFAEAPAMNRHKGQIGASAARLGHGAS